MGVGGGHRYLHVNIKNRVISVRRAVIESRQFDRKILSLIRFNFYEMLNLLSQFKNLLWQNNLRILLL